MEQQQLKLLAEYSNQDVTDVMNQARYNVKKNKIDKSQISSDLDEEQRAALISKAYMKDGKWMVNDVTGNARDLSSINANNIKDVQADSYEGKMSQGMEQIVSFTKLFTGDQEARMSQFSSAMQKSGEADKELQDRLEQSKKAFADEFQKNTNEIITNMQLATAAYSEILNQYKENDPIKENVENIDKNTEKIKEVMNALSEKMGAEIKASTGKKVDKDRRM